MSNEKLTTENSFDYADPEKRRAPELGGADGSAPAYDVFFGNNDYDTTGSTPAEALSEISFELETAISAVLLLRHGMTKADALKAVDDLRWLVEKSDLPNDQGETRRGE